MSFVILPLDYSMSGWGSGYDGQILVAMHVVRRAYEHVTRQAIAAAT